jgi:hypothetical protein
LKIFQPWGNREYSSPHGQSGEAYKSEKQSVVTNALVGVVAGYLISDGA